MDLQRVLGCEAAFRVVRLRRALEGCQARHRGSAVMAARRILTAPVPRNKVKRADFLLSRARFCIIRQAYEDLFRLLDSAVPSDEKARQRWVEQLRCLRRNCEMVINLALELEQVIASGQDGREYVNAKEKKHRDEWWLRRQLEGLDGGRA